MSSFENLLSIIENNIYGEDIRMAIHDALRYLHESDQSIIDSANDNDSASLIFKGTLERSVNLDRMYAGDDEKPSDYAGVWLIEEYNYSGLPSDYDHTMQGLLISYAIGSAVFQELRYIGDPDDTMSCIRWSRYRSTRNGLHWSAWTKTGDPSTSMTFRGPAPSDLDLLNSENQNGIWLLESNTTYTNVPSDYYSKMDEIRVDSLLYVYCISDRIRQELYYIDSVDSGWIRSGTSGSFNAWNYFAGFDVSSEINEFLSEYVEEHPLTADIDWVVIEVNNVDSLPIVVPDNRVTSDMVCMHYVLSDPSAMTGKLTVSSTDNAVSIGTTGALTGTTNLKLIMAQPIGIDPELIEEAVNAYFEANPVSSALETAIQEHMANNPVSPIVNSVEVNFSGVNSLPITYTSSGTEDMITPDMICIESLLSNPGAQIDDWVVTTSSGSVTVDGTISGTTDLKILLAQPVAIRENQLDMAVDNYFDQNSVQEPVTNAVSDYLAANPASATVKSVEIVINGISGNGYFERTVSELTPYDNTADVINMIEAGMVCSQWHLSNPSAQTSDWTVTTSNGRVKVEGNINGTTNLRMILSQPVSVTNEQLGTALNEYFNSNPVTSVITAAVNNYLNANPASAEVKSVEIVINGISGSGSFTRDVKEETPYGNNLDNVRAIEPGMVCSQWFLSNPAAQTNDWTVTTYNGRVTVGGNISGTTDLRMILAEPVKVEDSQLTDGINQYFNTHSIQTPVTNAVNSYLTANPATAVVKSAEIFINSISGGVNDAPTRTVNTSSLYGSSSTEVNKIEAGMVASQWMLSNPGAQIGDWTVTTGNKTVTVTCPKGTIAGSTNLRMILSQPVTVRDNQVNMAVTSYLNNYGLDSKINAAATAAATTAATNAANSTFASLTSGGVMSALWYPTPQSRGVYPSNNDADAGNITAKIQKLIDDNKGKTIYIPAGRWPINATLKNGTTTADFTNMILDPGARMVAVADMDYMLEVAGRTDAKTQTSANDKQGARKIIQGGVWDSNGHVRRVVILIHSRVVGNTVDGTSIYSRLDNGDISHMTILCSNIPSGAPTATDSNGDACPCTGLVIGEMGNGRFPYTEADAKNYRKSTNAFIHNILIDNKGTRNLGIGFALNAQDNNIDGMHIYYFKEAMSIYGTCYVSNVHTLFGKYNRENWDYLKRYDETVSFGWYGTGVLQMDQCYADTSDYFLKMYKGTFYSKVDINQCFHYQYDNSYRRMIAIEVNGEGFNAKDVKAPTLKVNGFYFCSNGAPAVKNSGGDWISPYDHGGATIAAYRTLIDGRTNVASAMYHSGINVVSNLRAGKYERKDTSGNVVETVAATNESFYDIFTKKLSLKDIYMDSHHSIRNGDLLKGACNNKEGWLYFKNTLMEQISGKTYSKFYKLGTFQVDSGWIEAHAIEYRLHIILNNYYFKTPWIALSGIRARDYKDSSGVTHKNTDIAYSTGATAIDTDDNVTYELAFQRDMSEVITADTDKKCFLSMYLRIVNASTFPTRIIKGVYLESRNFVGLSVDDPRNYTVLKASVPSALSSSISYLCPRATTTVASKRKAFQINCSSKSLSTVTTIAV